MLEASHIQARPPQMTGGAVAALYTRLGASPVVQLALIVSAHVALVLVAVLADFLWGDRSSGPPRITDESGRLVARLLLVGIALEGALAYVPFRVVARREQRPLRLFLRCWCASCLWALLVIPTAAAIVWAVQVEAFIPAFCTFVLLYLIVGPALFGRGVLRPQRIARWCPVCPECGYSLRGAVGTTCSECGCPFPGQTRTYRRWAVERLCWDRLGRGSLLISYVRTVLAVIVRPWRAAKGAAVPDRWPRAVRWAVFHLIVFALPATLLGSRLYFAGWAALRFNWAPARRLVAEPALPPAGVVLAWAIESYLTHLLGLATLIATALLVSAVLPAGRLARHSIAKWSLYAIVAIIPTALLWYPCQLSLSRGLVFTQTGFLARLLSIWRPAATTPAASLLAAAYGLWWAAGVSANPYIRPRGWRAFVLYLAGFLGLWLLLTSVLFDPGPLEYLK
jgi:hypothetical protein